MSLGLEIQRVYPLCGFKTRDNLLLFTNFVLSANFSAGKIHISVPKLSLLRVVLQL